VYIVDASTVATVERSDVAALYVMFLPRIMHCVCSSFEQSSSISPSVRSSAGSRDC